MSFIIDIYNTLLYQPLFNSLVFLYEYLPGRDFGIAVIILTLLIRALLYPSTRQAIRSQKALQELQPEIKKIQEKFKGDKEKEVKATFDLYKEKKINLFSGFLPLLIQFPFLIALYQVFWKGLRPEAMINLYNFIPNPGAIDPSFLNIANLSEPNIALAVLAGATQFLQTKMMMPKKNKEQPAKKKDGTGNFAEMMQKQMLYFLPIFTVVILIKLNLPSAIALYLVVTSLFSIGQQYLVFKKQKNA